MALYDEPISECVLIDGWIHYSTDLLAGDIVRIRTDGTDRQVLHNEEERT